jgi:hypothetical protein
MARIYIDIGDAMAVDPLPTGAWDLSAWDDPLALWAGTMPNWTEISCRVRGVTVDRGRRGVLEIFEPGPGRRSGVVHRRDLARRGRVQPRR